jgi:hypothetical protein
VKVQLPTEKPADTTPEAKPADKPPPMVQEVAKPIATSTPQPDPKPTVVEKASEMKPTEDNNTPAPNLPKIEEAKPRPIEEPPPKSEEKRSNVPNELKPAAADETQTKQPKAEEAKPAIKEPETKSEENKDETQPAEPRVEKPQTDPPRKHLKTLLLKPDQIGPVLAALVWSPGRVFPLRPVPDVRSMLVGKISR